MYLIPKQESHLFLLFVCLFICLRLGWAFVVVCRLFVAKHGSLPLVVVHRFSSYGTQTPEHMGPVVVAHGLFSYGVLTFLLRGI